MKAPPKVGEAFLLNLVVIIWSNMEIFYSYSV
jgi:hypothetical protein